MARKTQSKSGANTPGAKPRGQSRARSGATTRKGGRSGAAAASAVPAYPVAALPKLSRGQPSIRYRVEMPKPHSHNFEVTLEIEGAVGAHVDVAMPAWTPGSYKIREFSRNVSAFRAETGPGRELEWQLVDKQTWRVATNGAKHLRIRYRVYGFEYSVRTPHMDDLHAFFLPTNILMYVVGQLEAPSTMTIVPAPGWNVWCPLPRLKGGDDHTFVAENYDVLGDSPVECGDHQSVEFEVDGKRHEVVVQGWGNYDLAQMTKDFAAIVRGCTSFMGALPYENYLFVIQSMPGIRGGLEHLNSQVSAWGSYDFAERAQYEDFLSLIAHEFFHLWNVKRIRPAVLGPFDYRSEQYTSELWICEGLTEYYEWLILTRAGLIGADRWAKGMTRNVQIMDNRPAVEVMSLADSSFLAWTKLYLADENAVNTLVSYYTKGALVGCLLDHEIRVRTREKKSLDDMMRLALERHGWPKPGFAPGGFEKLCEEVCGGSLAAFFERNLRGLEPADITPALAAAGMSLMRDPMRETGADGVTRTLATLPWLGCEFDEKGGAVNVSSVRDGSPASDGGLSAKDVLLAIDGARVRSKGDVAKLLRMAAPGEPLEFTVFRDDFLRQLSVTPVLMPSGELRIGLSSEPTAAQLARRRAWLGVEK